MAEIVLEKKARKPVVLNVTGICGLCEYFVICSAETARQAQAIYEAIWKYCKEEKIIIHHRESDLSSQWILVDFFDVVIHIFTDAARNFYNLEYLWREAKKVRLRPAKKF